MLISLVRRRGLALAVAASLGLPAGAQIADDDILHLYNRIGYGATPELREELALPGAGTWNQEIVRQINWSNVPELADPLNPSGPTILDQLLSQVRPDLPNVEKTLENLQMTQFVLAFQSRRQLQVKMARFWDSHFNTPFFNVYSAIDNQDLLGVPTTEAQATAAAAELEWAEHQMFRQYGISSFKSLVVRSIKLGVPMGVFLNHNNNRRPQNQTASSQANENLARELLELYTVGPINESSAERNYISNSPGGALSDIQVLARLISGWKVVNGSSGLQMQYDDSRHFTNLIFPLTLFGATNPSGTSQHPLLFTSDLKAGNMDKVIDHLVKSDACKDFMCRKLIRYFIGEHANATPLLGQVKAQWGTTGNLPAVLYEILKSSQMQSSRNNLARTPFERVMWWSRTWSRRDQSPHPLQLAVVDPATQGAIGGVLWVSETPPPPQPPIPSLSKLHLLKSYVARMGQQSFAFPGPKGYSFAAADQISSGNTVATLQFQSFISDWVGQAPIFEYYFSRPSMEWQSGWLNIDSGQAADLILNRLYGPAGVAHGAVERSAVIKQLDQSVTSGQGGIVTATSEYAQLTNSIDKRVRFLQGIYVAGTARQAFVK